MKYVGKTSLSFVLSIILLFGFAVTSTYAATIGEALTAPEEGWTRFDDNDRTIIRSNGTWGYTKSENVQQTYGAGYYYSTDKNAKITFSFVGTKFRIIASRYIYQSSDLTLKIDGVEVGKYSAYSKSRTYQALLFEESNLKPGKHTIEIINNEAGKELSVDAIDLEEGAEFVDVNIPFDLKATGGDSSANLSWEKVQGAESYTVRYGTESGNYTETVTATKDEYGNYVIPGLTNGTTYYFVVTATVNGVESGQSNEASATPEQPETEEPSTPSEPGTEQPGTGEPTNPSEPTNPEQPGTEEPGTEQPSEPEQPSGNRAIMVVTMTTGLEKEFDLSMKEVNDFISWYEAKQAGSGKASYAIDKHENNKGPFSSRKDYILYDRVLTFEVSEY